MAINEDERKSAKISESAKKSGVKEAENQFWETAYIDGKYYLSDPISIAKLR